MSVKEGRDFYDREHSKSKNKRPQPKPGEKSVEAGRALYDNTRRTAGYD